MVSPVPKHLRTDEEHAAIHPRLRGHVINLDVDRSNGVDVPGSRAHRAKFAPGLATSLLRIAGTFNVGDPMAGTGMLAWETGTAVALNDIDHNMLEFLTPLSRWGCEVSCKPATEISWRRDACIFSPPYYPKADRCKPAAHNDSKRGPVVGFRDSYSGDHPEFVGNPGGVNAILRYREQMTRIYRHLLAVCNRMVVVTKNWTRLGLEMRLDLDTILMAHSVGWICTERHGWQPPPSLWSRFNAQRGGGVSVEDVLVFDKPLDKLVSFP
jgi:hypothetical protein